MSKFSQSPKMSSRSNPLPISKCPSTENVCKPKDDRVRNNTNYSKYKQRSDTFFSNSANGNYVSQPNNGKGQYSGSYKQPRSRGACNNKKTKLTKEERNIIGGKKVSLNHLLNFTYETEDVFVNHDQQKRFLKPKKGNGTSVYNKEHFIQANCQLIVKDGVDYSDYSYDVDLSMDWDVVEKVNIWFEEVPSCPICLSELYAARITKCGHMYCWPCILHYLALDDKTWRKCPICHEAVRKTDLKSVSVYKDHNLAVQEVITMQLMKRIRGSTVAVPVHDNLSENCYKFNDGAEPEEQRNMKYLIATPDQILESVVQIEKQQLEFKLATESDEFERTFIKSALELLSVRECALLDSLKEKNYNCAGKSDEVLSGDKNSEDLVLKNVNNNSALTCNDKTESPRMTKNKDASPIPNTVCEEEIKFEDKVEKSEERIYYFYQSKDGQHVYLHPINVRCLLHQYGSFERCPSQINAKIVEIEQCTMNETARKRYRYLSHLPSSLEFRIAEVDLRPPVVTMATLATFRESLDRRVALRRKKARDEKRILRKAQTEALRKQGRYPSARICLENQQQFPHIQQSGSSSSFSVLLPSPGTTPGNESYITPPSTSSSSIASSVEDNVPTSSDAAVSFAQMLRSSNADDHSSWPRKTPLLRHSSPTVSSTDVLVDDVDDDYAAPPDYQSSFGDALCSALDNLTPLSENNGKRSKKGKKGKKLLLFSTSSQHH